MPLRILALLVLTASAGRQEPSVRVACLGDSITFGARIADHEHGTFPARLAYRLGAGYEVRNFGVGGRTLLHDADQPYVDTDEYRAALAWRPDVAIVILGTNDTCQDGLRKNWEHEPDLERDARELVREIVAVNGHARILLCSPPSMFPAAPGLDRERIADLRARAPRLAAIQHAMRSVASESERVEHVDLARAVAADRVVDGVHPDPFGADAIAERLAAAITAETAPAPPIASTLAEHGVETEQSDFHGFRRLAFRQPGDGGPCSIVTPHVTAAGAPWIWRISRAGDLGDELRLDLALLDRGFHVVSCDVSGLEEPAAERSLEGFHALSRELGLAERGMLASSRSTGFDERSFASSHPELVAPFEDGADVVEIRAGDDVGPTVRAVLRAFGLGANPAALPLPSAEYRGAAAGWSGRTWWEELGRMRALAGEHPDIELVFLGDSITQGLTGADDRLAHAGGERAFDRFHGARKAVSLGLSGDRTEHLLYRIEHGALPLLDPRVIVLQIGVNNVNSARHSGAETAEGIAAVVAALRAREPQAAVLVCGPFPLGDAPDDPRRTEIDRTHELVAPLDDGEHVLYLDLRPLFLDGEGRPSERMAADHVHVTAAGQAAWMEALEPLVVRLLGR